MRLNKTISLLITALIGFVFLHYVMVIPWAYIPNINPLSDWLIEDYAGAVWFRPVLYVHDFIINIVLVSPLAVFIYYLRPSSYVLYALVAVMPEFIWTNLELIYPPYFTQAWLHVLTPRVMSLACLPVALAIVIWLGNRRMPKHKPKGLSTSTAKGK